MSYTGTVRCSHCYQSGHNKTSCPELKKEWEKDPNSYYGRQWAAIQARKAKPKICGYCGEEGHTRRTCAERKRQVKERLAEVLDIRKRTAQRMMDAGFGPGALISVDHNLQGQNAVMAVVTEVRFDDIRKSHVPSKDDYFQGAHGIKFQYLVPKEDSWSGTRRTHGSCYFPVDYLNVDNIPRDEWYRNPQNDSCELMRRIDDASSVREMLRFIRLEKWCK